METFGLKEWIEGICLYCKGDKASPEQAKVIQNLGKIQDMNNSISVPNKNGIYQTRPANVFTNMEALIKIGNRVFTVHNTANHYAFMFPVIIYNKQKGIYSPNQ